MSQEGCGELYEFKIPGGLESRNPASRSEPGARQASGLLLQDNQRSFWPLYSVPGGEGTPEPLLVNLKFSPHGQKLLVELKARFVILKQRVFHSEVDEQHVKDAHCPWLLFQSRVVKPHFGAAVNVNYLDPLT